MTASGSPGRPRGTSRLRALALGAGVLGVAVMGGWGVSAALRVQALRHEIDAAQEDIGALKVQERKLTETIDRLRNDPDYIEKLAREEQGKVRPDEEVLKFPSRAR